MRRKALIAEHAAGPAEVADHVLARFGFAGTTQASNLADALARMREEHFDLVVLPLHDADTLQLLAVDREIRKNPTASVIGTSQTPDPNLILRAMRAGIHEFLVSPPTPEELSGAIERLMRRSRAESRRGEVITVYTAKGGLGCSSIAVNLAQGFATTRIDTRVAVADLVVSGGDLRVLLNLKPDYDLGHLVAKGDQVDAELLNSLLTPCPGGIWALPTSDNPEFEDSFDAPAIAAIIEMLRSHFGVTVLDCEHHLSERTLTALDAADRILLVTHLSIASLRSTQRTLSVCRRLGYDDGKLCVVVNRFGAADVLPLKDAESLLQAPVYWTIPNDYHLSAMSLTRGVPVALEDPGSKLARSYVELALKLGGGAGTRPVVSTERDGKRGKLRKLFGNVKGAGNVT